MLTGWRKTGAIGCVALLVAFAPACSDDPQPAADEQTADSHDHSHDYGESGDNFRFILGKPADESDATRTVQVDATKGFEFAPTSLRVKAGETITFEVTNNDRVEHEFVLGNRDYQELHESQVKAGGVYHNYSDYSVHVMPGETGSVTWRFERSGKLQYACHVEGHYDQGMIGSLAVS